VADDKPAGKSQPDRQPTLAEAARALVRDAKHGILCTLIPEGGFPYGSLAEVLPLPDGDVVLFLSRLAGHQHYLSADPRASIVIAPAINDAHALARPRVSLVGRVEVMEDRAAFAEAYAALHPDARAYIDFPDFQFYRLRVEQVRYIAGFGQMGWIRGNTYRAAGSA
jgi:putative heme iron utilization protein